MRKCKMCGSADKVDVGYCPTCGRILSKIKEEDMEERVIADNREHDKDILRWTQEEQELALAHMDEESALLSVDPPEDVPQDEPTPF